MLFTRKNGHLPDYTEDGKTIKSYLETGCSRADKEIRKILNEFLKSEVDDLDMNFNQQNFFDVIKNLNKIPYLFEDSEMCKETTNPIIDFFIDYYEESGRFNENEIVIIYQGTAQEVANEYYELRNNI